MGSLKEQVALVDGQVLVFAGRSLADDLTLAECGVQEESTLFVTAGLLGGGKKRRKKVYTKPKKIPHKRKKVKLAVLKFYKVDGGEKAQRYLWTGRFHGDAS